MGGACIKCKIVMHEIMYKWGLGSSEASLPLGFIEWRCEREVGSVSISAPQRGSIGPSKRSGIAVYIRFIFLASDSMFTIQCTMNSEKWNEKAKRNNAKLTQLFAYANDKRPRCGRALSK